MDLQELTKKNQEFVTIATHQLKEDGKSEQEIEAIFDEVLPTIIENQKKGYTARSLYGAPTNWAKSFTESATSDSATQSNTNTNPWLMWLDSALLILGFFEVIYGLTSLFNKHSQNPYGLLTIFIISAVGGAVFYALYHFVYRYAGKPKNERPSMWKSALYLIGFSLLWIGIVGASAIIPKQINPTLPAMATLIIGAISFALKFYLKKRYNIQSALSPQRPEQN